MIDTKFLQCETLIFFIFLTYAFYIKNKLFSSAKVFFDLKNVTLLKLSVDKLKSSAWNCWEILSLKAPTRFRFHLRLFLNILLKVTDRSNLAEFKLKMIRLTKNFVLWHISTFGSFPEIFQESRVHFWTSDSDFRDLLDELFNMAKKDLLK